MPSKWDDKIHEGRYHSSHLNKLTSQNRALYGFVKLAFLLFIVSACSLAPSATSTPTPAAKKTTIAHPTTATPTPLSDEDLAARMVQAMTLDEKLGQMVIVEFYGSTLTSDLQQMIQGNHVSGVLIENKNGNAQDRNQLIALNKAMQGQAHVPLFISTDYEGGVVNELRRITGERPSEAEIGASSDPQVAYKAGHDAAADLTGLGLNVNFMP